jgi:hypothetical protein
LPPQGDSPFIETPTGRCVAPSRFANRVASRAEAIRQLIELGLKTAQGGETKPAKAQAR